MNIDKIINYVIQFQNMKYVLAHDSDFRILDGPPFWNTNTPPKDINFIKTKGSCCTGLPNLVRRYIGLEIPGNIKGFQIHECVGGTDAWFKYLNNTNRLEKIDSTKIYPKGTLLVQNYNKNDQGHLAILIDSDKFLYKSNIIHNINGIWNNKKYNSTVIEKFKDYPYNTRFTHICLANNWLKKN